MTSTEGLLTVLPAWLALLPAIPVWLWILRRGGSQERMLFALLALAHVTAVVALAIFPIPIAGQDYYRRTRGFSEDNIVPFATIASQLAHLSLNTVRQLGGNVLALMPLGVYGPELWPALRDPRRFVVLAVAVAVGIELAQLAGSLLEGFTYRVTDVDDAIMNASGAIVAYAVYRAWRWPGARRPLGAELAADPAGPAAHPAADPAGPGAGPEA
jgi:glycopeptide antibiotics resistance protein